MLETTPSLVLEGVINKIIFRNEETAYVVMEVETAVGRETVVGYAANLAAGESIRALGDYVTHASYGRQFAAVSIESVLPSDTAGILAYLESGAIKGIGKTLARRIVERFSEQALEVLDQQPELLCEIKGVTPAKARQLSQRYRQIQGVRRVLAELGAFRIPPYVAVKLYKRYGFSAVDALRQNPYLLCGEEYGMGFDMVDNAAAELFSIAADSPVRVRAGLLHVLEHNLGNGHTFLPLEALISTTAGFLAVESDLVTACLEELERDDEVVCAPVANLEAVFLQRYYSAEKTVAERLLSMSTPRPCGRDVGRLVDAIASGLGIEYAAMQRRAIAACAENGVFILTGGPGTGKTTTLHGILALLDRLELTTLLAAPTGRAAKRMTELTGAKATTIHRMLGITLRAGVPTARYHEKNPLDADVVIVDEVSMLEITLFDALLRAMRPSARLILVGDANQLPPIGAGNILRDLLGSELFPSVELTEIFRQSRDSLIVVNAHRINRGEYPEFNERDNDFFLVSCKERAKAAELLTDLVARRLPDAYHVDPIDEIQVLSPTRKGEAGTVFFNEMLQKALNPPAAGKNEVTVQSRLFREGDKVMQIQNNYDLPVILTDTGEISQGLYNGDVGRILEISRSEEVMTICFDDRQVEYPFECLHQLELAYAVTVHKSQGSEYPIVVLAAYPGMGRLQTRNLFYTAVTRARRIFVALGDEAALYQMTDNSREDRRFSALKYLLLDQVSHS